MARVTGDWGEWGSHRTRIGDVAGTTRVRGYGMDTKRPFNSWDTYKSTTPPSIYAQPMIPPPDGIDSSARHGPHQRTAAPARDRPAFDTHSASLFHQFDAPAFGSNGPAFLDKGYQHMWIQEQRPPPPPAADLDDPSLDPSPPPPSPPAAIPRLTPEKLTRDANGPPATPEPPSTPRPCTPPVTPRAPEEKVPATDMGRASDQVILINRRLEEVKARKKARAERERLGS